MTLSKPGFVLALESVAAAAQRAEVAFRNNIAAEIERHERERQFAYRRVSIATAMAAAAKTAESEEQAVVAQADALKSEIGWHSDTERRQRVLDAWKAVAVAVWRELQPATAADAENPDAGALVRHAMVVFEAWYEAEFGVPFLAILDYEIPEMPVVEF